MLLQASKKMLMENDFLQSLRSFDKDHIPVPVVQKIKPYIANPEFEPNKILTVSMQLPHVPIRYSDISCSIELVPCDTSLVICICDLELVHHMSMSMTILWSSGTGEQGGLWVVLLGACHGVIRPGGQGGRTQEGQAGCS